MENFKYRWVWGLAIVIVALTVIIMMNKNDTLDKYVESSVPTTIGESTEADDNEYITYKGNGSFNYSVEIPYDWTETNKEGIRSFTDKLTETTVQIRFSDYVPTYNNVTEESVRSNVLNAGYQFIEFVRINNCSYICSYKNNSAVFTDFVIWDRNNICEIIGTAKLSLYEKMYNTIEKCIKSFNWIQANPLPDTGSIVYFEYGNFESYFPSDWASIAQQNSLIITDPNTGSIITINVNKSTNSLNDISEKNYLEFISSSRPECTISEFSNQGDKIIADFSYTKNGKLYSVNNYIMTNGKYEYNIYIEYLPSDYEKIYKEVNAFLNNFRVFN